MLFISYTRFEIAVQNLWFIQSVPLRKSLHFKIKKINKKKSEKNASLAPFARQQVENYIFQPVLPVRFSVLVCSSYERLSNIIKMRIQFVERNLPSVVCIRISRCNVAVTST